MIILGQSYVSPFEMSADNDIFTCLKKKFGNKLNVVTLKGKQVRALTKKETIIQSVRCWRTLSTDDFFFGWGGDITIYTYLISSILGGVNISYIKI